jgi:diguanylate cyclase (GGDEF)-like protein
MSRRRSLRSLGVLVGSVVGAAVTCLSVAAVAAVRSPPPSLPLLAGCLALLVAGVRCHLKVRLGAERVEINWNEAALILAFAVLPSPWVVLITPVAVGANYVQRRFAPIKTVYNAASCTVAAAAASGFLALTGASRPFAGLNLLALAGAATLAALVSLTATRAVVAVVREVSVFAILRESGSVPAFTLIGNLGLAASVLVLFQYDPRLIITLPPVGLLLHGAYVGLFRAHQERQAGRRQPSAIRHLTADLDELGVIRRTAREVAVLMQADAVDVEVLDPEGSPSLLYRHFRRGDPWIGPPKEARRLPGQVAARVSITGQGKAPIGEVRVWLASSAANLTLSSSDQDAVEILAAAAATALGNARIYAEQRRLARTDRTTGLPTRQVLLERIEETGCGTTRPSVALILIDITGFRGVVRTLGHDTAEELLARTGRQLGAAGAGEDLAFVAGDDFAVYLSDASDPARVRDLARSLVDAVAEPLQLPVGTVTLDAVAGIAYSPVPVTSGVELLRQATYAMEQARARNLKADFYEPGEDMLGGPSAVIMASELHEALENGELDFHYQPIVHLLSRAPVAVEALVRWTHPTKGLMLPREFMPVLEQSRDHTRFVTWQLDQALRARARWNVDRDLPISVNLAARCFLDRAFPKQVRTALERWQVAPDQLMLELTDTPALTGSATATAVLNGLLDLGVRIAIDSFGTGHGSLIGLLELPATDLKIGNDFVRLVLVDGRAMGVVRMAIELGRLSDLRVTALGVPDEEHVEALQRVGCDVGQGNYLAPPMLASELRDYLAAAPPAPVDEEAGVIALDRKRLVRRR